MADSNYWDYEFTWSYLKNILEWFNEKWPSYRFYIEPFLDSDIVDIVGVFNDYGLIVFFIIDKNYLGKFTEENSSIDIKRIRINPNNLITNKDLEMLLINYSINFMKKHKGDM